MTISLRLRAGKLSLADIKKAYDNHQALLLDDSCKTNILAAKAVVDEYVSHKRIAYGINTGFGKLANVVIPEDHLPQLQKNLVLSHACGVGKYLEPSSIRIVMLLKINALIQGYSGVSWQLIEALVALYNAAIYPCIPEKGSVGASGDLAPLAHMSLALLGEGEVMYQNHLRKSADVLREVGLRPLILAPKEGLALLNGTQVSTALLA
ncbi:MAG TPA: aromatic amino acid lyase, partial [Candidatus Berkiella sp.]|nr:aromatic amino acid lyase [Candidatus Berkiella sp.]